MMAKASYMPFEPEDRLEIFSNKRGLVGGMGGFDQQAGSGGGVSDEAWRGGGVSVASAGLDVWPSAYSEIGDPTTNATTAAEMSWGRQQQQLHEAGDAGQQHQHQQVRFDTTLGAAVQGRSVADPFCCPLSWLRKNSFSAFLLRFIFMWRVVCCVVNSFVCVCVCFAGSYRAFVWSPRFWRNLPSVIAADWLQASLSVAHATLVLLHAVPPPTPAGRGESALGGGSLIRTLFPSRHDRRVVSLKILYASRGSSLHDATEAHTNTPTDRE